MACYASTAWPGGRARVYSAQHNTQLLSTCLNMGGKMSVVLSRRSGKYGATRRDRLIQLVRGEHARVFTYAVGCKHAAAGVSVTERFSIAARNPTQ